MPSRREPEDRGNGAGALWLLRADAQNRSPGRAKSCTDVSCLRTGFCLEQDQPSKMTALFHFPICAESQVTPVKCWRKLKQITPSYDKLPTAAMAVLSGGGRGGAASEDGAWWGLLCCLRGCSCTRTGLLLDGRFLGTRDWNGRKEGERKMERETGSYIQIKSHTTAISSIFATHLNKRRLGAIRSKAHPASAPFTVLPPSLLDAIISRSLLPLGALTRWQVSTGGHGNPLCSRVPRGRKQVHLSKQGAREDRGRKKNLSLL